MASVLEVLRQIKDPRGRRGRIYPLYGVLSVLLLAAMQGETSLRGMWLWGKLRAQQLRRHKALGLEWGYPALSTVWYMLSRLDAAALSGVLRPWLAEEEEYILDGKALRGSKRAAEQALHVVTVAGRQLGYVAAQRKAENGDELAAALAVLEGLPLEGKIVSADAGILKTAFAQKVIAKKGAISGPSRTTNAP